MRTRVLFGAASVVGVVGMLWGSVVSARACTCGPIGPGDGEQVYAQQADAIVLGTVVELIPTREPYEGFEGKDVDAVVAVARYEKGSGPSEVVLQDGAVCGIFEDADVGKAFRLYLSVEGSSASSGWCSGSHEIDEALLDDAPSGQPAEGAEIGTQADGRFPVGAAIAIAIAGSVAILAGTVFLARRGSRQRMGSE